MSLPATAPKTGVVSTASEIIESLAIRLSSSIYAYDLALQHDFGTLAKEWFRAHPESAPPVLDVQTRAGAGLGIVGRMSEGTSAEGSKASFVITALTTPTGLAQMTPALSSLGPATAGKRLVLQVPTLSILPNSLSLSPSLESLASTLFTLPDTFSIIASANAQEAAELAAAAYAATSLHVIHLFDAYNNTREVRKLTYPQLPDTTAPSVSIKDALAAAGHDLFTYSGPDTATDVFVAINGTLAQSVKALIAHSSSSGLVSVRVIRPWDVDAFIGVLPSHTKRIHVLDDVANLYSEGPLYQDVLSSTLAMTESPTPWVKSLRVTPTTLHTYLSNPTALRTFLSDDIPKIIGPPAPSPAAVKKMVFYGVPDSPLSSLAEQITQPFFSTKSIHARLLSNSDAFSKPGGVTFSRVVLSPSTQPEDTSFDVLLPTDDTNEAAFTGIFDSSLIKTHDVLRYAQPGSPVLIYTSWTPEELVANLPDAARTLILERDLQIYTFDSKRDSVDVQRALAHVAFLRLYVGEGTSEDVVKRLAKRLLGGTVDGVSIETIVRDGWGGLAAVVVPPLAEEANGHADATTKKKKNAQVPAVLQPVAFNTISLVGFGEEVNQSERNAPISGAWHEAAKHILFSEAYAPASTQPLLALRPEVAEPTFLVTCTVNRRLTPKSYSRNVFHMEFDTTSTGLKYEIGEALGIFGWNDEGDVLDFCDWYGVDPNKLISVPVPGVEGQKATRTVFQALQQQVDIFGRPPKAFFAALATYATERKERMALLFISAPEGAAMLKKLGETDTVSYADVLRLYPSARPSIEELCVIVNEIKERHYSIASAQSVVGNRVDLLVVTVDWVTPSGTPKYGQCTRYLAGLKAGNKVTVSIKPSVMKLPPSDLQPIIMAGLGTGAAPFRAFIQHRAMLKNQGKAVGPLLYYFGSRHRSQEYLYGEEIEAYIADGIITHAGLAFSRDSDSKVYIQHKMQNDGKILAGMIGSQGEDWSNKGVFYLCGPTWPVPDVFEALVNALVNYAGLQKDAASAYLEALKEEERYVLEVY